MYSNLVSTWIDLRKLHPHQFLMTNGFKWLWILIFSYEPTNEMQIYVFTYPFDMFTRMFFNDKKSICLKIYLIFAFYQVLLLFLFFLNLNKWHFFYAETQNSCFWVILVTCLILYSLILLLFSISSPLHTYAILWPQYFLTWNNFLHVCQHH